MFFEKMRQFALAIRDVLKFAKGVIEYRSQILKSKKNKIQTLYQILRYEYYWRDPGAIKWYFYYNLDDKEKSLRNILEYIPTGAHYRIQGLTRYREYECLAYDKRYEYMMFEKMNLSHPPVVLLIFEGIVTDSNFNQIDEVAAMKLLVNSGTNRFFLKPSFSGGTRGTDVITLVDGVLNRLDNSVTCLHDLIGEAKDLPSGYVLQCEMKRQHPTMRNPNPDSVNTLRIITYRMKEEFKILRIVFRIGRKGRPFDNSIAGGVFIYVDPDSFVTGERCFIENPRVEEVGNCHPDTNVKLSNLYIPFANEIKEMLKKATIIYNEHTYLGWDIAITEEGPSIIEVNLNFDIDQHQTAASRGVRADMMYDPKRKIVQRSKWKEVGIYWKSLAKSN